MKIQCKSVRFTFQLIGLLILFLGTVSMVSAQSNTGIMLGTVKDASGAVVAGATVTARNTDTNFSRSFTTLDDGAYRIIELPVGPYEIRAEHEGFKSDVHSGLVLTVSQEEVVNFTLEVGATQQTVSVTGEVESVDTTSSTVGGTVNQTTLVDLPLNGRSYEDLTFLQPGVSDNKNQNNANRGSVGHYFQSNGATIRSNNYYLDGTSLVNEYGASAASIVGTTLGVDAIQEYRVVTSGVPAELGMVMGSQMLMVSRGGTNAFHGSAFEFIRNSLLDAKNYFDNSALIGHRLPEYQRNDFGGSFGGPIKKDKFFFYVAYEGLRENKGITTVTTDLPAATDAFGNAIAGGACRGAAGATLTAGTALGQCALLVSTKGGTNNAIVSAGQTFTVAAVMAPFLTTAMYPLPNQVSGAGTASVAATLNYQYQQPSVEDYGQARLDYNLSASDTVFARWTDDEATQSQTQPYPEYVADLYTIGQWGTIGENHIFSPTVLNTFRGSFSRSDIAEFPAYGAGTSAATFPGTNLVAGQQNGGISSLAGGFTGAAAASGPITRFQNIFAAQDDLNYTRGKHSFKFGILMNHYLQTAAADASLKGSLTFTQFSQYVQGLYEAESSALSGSTFTRTVHYTTIGAYAQDDYRITPRLTLNLGLRYEIETMPFALYQAGTAAAWSAFQAPAIDQPVTMTPTPGGRLYAKNPSLRNFGPRVGFAWDVMGDGKTSVRGAYDLLYDIGDVASQWLQTAVGQPPIAIRSTNTVTPIASQTLVSIPYNQCVVNTPGCVNPTFGAASFSDRPLDYFQKQPYMHLYNLTVDRQLPWSSILTVSYVGSRGIHLMDDVDGNPTIPSGLVVGTGVGQTCVGQPAGSPLGVLTGPGSLVSGSATGCYAPGGLTSVTNGPNPRVDLLSIASPSWTDTYTSRADSWYNALQVGVTKRLTQGLQVQASYTWSRNFDTNPGQLDPDQNGTGSLFTSNPLNTNTDRGPASTDIPNNFKLNVIYYIPNVKSDNKILKGVANGWWMSAIFTSLSGFGFTPNLQSNLSNSETSAASSGLDRPNWATGFGPGSNITSGTSAGCGTPVLGVLPNLAGVPLGTTKDWYDPCAFTLQNAGFLGDVSRDSIRGPDFRNVDYSIVKDTDMKWLGEAGRVEFRAEFFNLLNNHNFALPGRVIAGNNATTPSTEADILSTVGTSRQIQFALKLIF